nr:retrovirus-related Pol polyprotein from transposon TNT 1-94 [Tanacetum cinerariifolium]
MAKIVESKNANHSEPNHTWGSIATDIPSSYSLIMTGTIRFRNDQIVRIMGYDDYQLGNIIISRVYYVEGLGHNLFSVGQFCDADLKVAFRKNTCFIRNLEGVDLLSGSRDINLYTISLYDMLKSSSICLLSKASKTKSWLWHQQLSHLNFGTLNKLAKDGLAQGIPRLKFQKDHLCSTCTLGKSKKSSHQPKAEDTNPEKLYLLHMDLYGPMHVAFCLGLRLPKKHCVLPISKFLRYIDTRPNGDALRKCILNGPYIPTTVVVQAVAATDDSSAIPEHTTEAIERLQQGESLNIQDVKTNLIWEFVSTMQVNVQFLQQLQPEWSRFITIVKQQHKLDEVSYHKLFDILKQYQKEVNELCAERLARNAKPLALVAIECKKPKRVKDSAYHKEKMLLCKQAEKGVPLQAEQYDWLADAKKEIDEQELKAHYSYIEKIQENDQNDVESDDEHVALANLIANLKLDVDENKKIQKQLKKANTTLAQELKECKTILAETSKTPGESNSVRDSCLVALQNKQTEFEKYKIFNDCTVDYEKLKHKLNKTLGQLAQKDIKIKEGLKLKAYEILVVKEKNDELIKQILLTKSHYEGLVKHKTKVTTDLKLKEEHDIAKMLSLEKHLKFLNKIVYKRSQSIQTIHMMAPKVPTYNGRPTFANPRYLKQAQSEIPCLYAFPNDQSTHANRLIPNGKETLDLERESRSKLNKDLVRPYDYTTLNSLYENFKPPTQELEIQLAHVKSSHWQYKFPLPVKVVTTAPCTIKGVL